MLDSNNPMGVNWARCQVCGSTEDKFRHKVLGHVPEEWLGDSEGDTRRHPDDQVDQDYETQREEWI